MNLELNLFVYWVVILAVSYGFDRLQYRFFNDSLSDYGWKSFSNSYAIFMSILQGGLFVIGMWGLSLVLIWFNGQ